MLASEEDNEKKNEASCTMQVRRRAKSPEHLQHVPNSQRGTNPPRALLSGRSLPVYRAARRG